MKEPLNLLQTLGERARMETAPKVDVTRNVLRAIRQTEAPADRVMMVFALCSATAASFAIGYCVYVYYVLTDPLSGFFQTMPGIIS